MNDLGNTIQDTLPELFKSVVENLTDFIGICVKQAPLAMRVFKGKTHVVEMAYGLMLEIWGKKEGEVIGKPQFTGFAK